MTSTVAARRSSNATSGDSICPLTSMSFTHAEPAPGSASSADTKFHFSITVSPPPMASPLPRPSFTMMSGSL